jgi:Holliday junction resolvasome RuvABC DNA-binding subunit
MKQVHIGYGFNGEKGRELFEQLAGIAVPFISEE